MTRLPKALHDVVSRDNVSEAVVLSTCNRTEIYVVAEKFHGAYADVRNFLAEMAFLPPEGFADHLYVHYDAEAVEHLFEVAAGLDSAVVGENETLSVRHAWERAQTEAPYWRSTCCSATPRAGSGRTDTAISPTSLGVLRRPAMATSAGTRGLWSSCRRATWAGHVASIVGAGAGDVRIANRTGPAGLLTCERGATAIRLADSRLRSPTSTCCSRHRRHVDEAEHGDLARLWRRRSPAAGRRRRAARRDPPR
jgi:glutamyl-tRNA reductase